jgi:hypothetical protein
LAGSLASGLLFHEVQPSACKLLTTIFGAELRLHYNDAHRSTQMTVELASGKNRVRGFRKVHYDVDELSSQMPSPARFGRQFFRAHRLGLFQITKEK